MFRRARRSKCRHAPQYQNIPDIRCELTDILRGHAAAAGQFVAGGFPIKRNGKDVKEVLVVKLSTRFAVDNLFVIGGTFLAVSAMALSAPVVGWLGFGVFTGLAVVADASAAAA
jgi:hypothetical protein